jgi:hypothetical protein
MLWSVLRMLRTPFPMLRKLFPCCEHLFPCCEHFSYVANTFSMLRPYPSFPDKVYMLRVCGEYVANLWRACRDQYPNIVLRTLFPCCEHLLPCCEHFFHVASPPSPRHIIHVASDVTSLWRACCNHHPNIRCEVDGQLGGRPIFPHRTPDQEHCRKDY